MRTETVKQRTNKYNKDLIQIISTYDKELFYLEDDEQRTYC